MMELVVLLVLFHGYRVAFAVVQAVVTVPYNAAAYIPAAQDSTQQ